MFITIRCVFKSRSSFFGREKREGEMGELDARADPFSFWFGFRRTLM